MHCRWRLFTSINTTMCPWTWPHCLFTSIHLPFSACHSTVCRCLKPTRPIPLPPFHLGSTCPSSASITSPVSPESLQEIGSTSESARWQHKSGFLKRALAQTCFRAWYQAQFLRRIFGHSWGLCTGKGAPLVRYLCTTWESLHMFFTKRCPWVVPSTSLLNYFWAFLGPWGRARGRPWYGTFAKSESVKCRFSKCRFSVLNLKFDFISDGGGTREKQIQKALGSLPPCGNRCRFSESAICSSRVHPPSEIKSNFKFKTLRWRPLRWRLTLSDLKTQKSLHGRHVWETLNKCLVLPLCRVAASVAYWLLSKVYCRVFSLGASGVRKSSSHGPRNYIHSLVLGRGSKCPWQFSPPVVVVYEILSQMYRDA